MSVAVCAYPCSAAVPLRAIACCMLAAQCPMCAISSFVAPVLTCCPCALWRQQIWRVSTQLVNIYHICGLAWPLTMMSLVFGRVSSTAKPSHRFIAVLQWRLRRRRRRLRWPAPAGWRWLRRKSSYHLRHATLPMSHMQTRSEAHRLLIWDLRHVVAACSITARLT